MEEFNKILLLTIVCCMACDGEIAKEEVETLKKMSQDLNLFAKDDEKQIISIVMDSLAKYGYDFVKSYLELLEKKDFNEQQEFQILNVATITIHADNIVKYDEIKFFKTIRQKLKITDEQILSQIEGVEDYWLSADAQDSCTTALERNFNSIAYKSIDWE